MTLNWDVTKVKDHEEITTRYDEAGKPNWSYITLELVNVTQAVGISKITVKNADEFYFRMSLWMNFHSSFYLNSKMHTVILTLQDVKNHIGMFTNAPDYPRTEFLKRLFKHVVSLGDVYRVLDTQTTPTYMPDVF